MLLCCVMYVKNVDIEEVKIVLIIIMLCMKNVGDRYFILMQELINLNDRCGILKNMVLFQRGYNYKIYMYVLFLYWIGNFIYFIYMNIKLFIVRFGLNWLWSVDVCVGVCGGGDEG